MEPSIRRLARRTHLGRAQHPAHTAGTGRARHAGRQPARACLTCFIVNLYFIQGVLAAIDPARMIYGVLEAAISLTLFVAALLYTRWSYQYERKAAGEA